jgi:ornithine cyclodeaminase/alanine dehydrogenase
MVLFINSEDVKTLFDMGDFVEAIEESYKLLGHGEISMLPRINVDSKKTRGFLKLLPANVSGLNMGGLQVYTSGTDKGVQKIIPIFDLQSGALKAIIEADRVSWMRTGAASAVATKYLARQDAKVVGIFGSGRQARSQLLAISVVRKIEKVKVYSPKSEHRLQYCREMEKLLSVEVVPVEGPIKAVVGSDIISTATLSKKPVFDGNWIENGTHINAIGAHYPDQQEVDETAVMRSKFVVDSRERALKEEGELLIPIRKGIIKDTHIYAELADIVAEKVKGRQNAEDITLFTSGGMASECIVAAARIYEKAISNHVGQHLNIKRDDSLPRALYSKREK